MSPNSAYSLKQFLKASVPPSGVLLVGGPYSGQQLSIAPETPLHLIPGKYGEFLYCWLQAITPSAAVAVPRGFNAKQVRRALIKFRQHRQAQSPAAGS